LRVQPALHQHVEGRSPGGAEQRPAHEVEEGLPVEAAVRGDVVADGGRDRDHYRDPGLRQRDEVLERQPRRGGGQYRDLDGFHRGVYARATSNPKGTTTTPR